MWDARKLTKKRSCRGWESSEGLAETISLREYWHGTCGFGQEYCDYDTQSVNKKKPGLKAVSFEKVEDLFQ